MGTPRYTEEFKVEAVRQVLDRGHRVSEVAQRLGVSPYSLHLELRKTEAIADDTVVEITPSFAGAPSDWLERFDARRDVPDCYDVPTPEGIVQVLITPQVKAVLQEINGCRCVEPQGLGPKPILNRYATLGPAASQVSTGRRAPRQIILPGSLLFKDYFSHSPHNKRSFSIS